MTYEHLILEARGDTEWLTMNRPEALNVLNMAMVDEPAGAGLSAP
jgi:enoyl-CoA hydratase/carnithine racemase